MKKLIFILVAFIGIQGISMAQCSDELLGVCYPAIGNYKFLKSYPIKMKKSKKGQPPGVAQNSIVLNAGVTYRVTPCNASEYEGKLVVSLYSGDAMVSSSYDPKSKTHYPGFEFQCRKSGVYYLSFYFDEGLEGCGMVLLSQKN
ncbi:MAG: hypothetical protein WCK02_11880 [Bacteroidota bacterium]